MLANNSNNLDERCDGLRHGANPPVVTGDVFVTLERPLRSLPNTFGLGGIEVNPKSQINFVSNW